MNHIHTPGHSVTIEVGASWESAFDYLVDPLNLGKWALGCWETESSDIKGLYVGRSLFDNEKSYFRIEENRELHLLDFFIGDKTVQQPCISIRIVAGVVYGQAESSCLLTINAWRDINSSDERWRQLCVCHETEIILLKALIEREDSV